jgi:hypothetical protein
MTSGALKKQSAFFARSSDRSAARGTNDDDAYSYQASAKFAADF